MDTNLPVQTSIPGTAPDIRRALQTKADRPMMGKAAQASCEVGLFSDGHKQKELGL